MGEDQHEPGHREPGEGARARCVVLAPGGRGSGSFPELDGALRAKDLEIIDADDAYDALASVLSATGDDGGPRRPVILLLVEPRLLEAGDRLLDAATRYAPAAARWQYDPAGEPPLRAADDPRPGRPSVVVVPSDDRPAIRPAPADDDTPRLRLAGEGSPDPADGAGDGLDAPPDADGAEDDGPVLSDEELRMLLSDDWRDQTRERPGT